MKIVAGSSNIPLAQKIAQELHLTLTPIEIHIFPDGEKRVRVLERVVDEEVIVVQPTASNVDENYMELFFIIDALKRSGAKSIIGVMPYMGYQRQDHIFRSGEVVSSQAVIAMLEVLGLSYVIAVDLHSIRIPELFHIPVHHVSALPLFAEKITELGFTPEDTVLISPDMGGIRRIKQISEILGNMSVASIVKNRDLATGLVTADEIEGEVKRKAVIVDDMISSGKTIATAVGILQKKGVEEIVVCATHPVFSEDAPSRLQGLNVQKVMVTDSIFVPEERQFEKLEVLSLAPLIASTITQSIS